MKWVVYLSLFAVIGQDISAAFAGALMICDGQTVYFLPKLWHSEFASLSEIA